VANLDKVYFTDETGSRISGYVKQQNLRVWNDENAHKFHEQQLHSLKIGVQCGVSSHFAIGTIFFFQTGVRQDCLFRLHFMKFMSNINNSSAQYRSVAE
jgi:hypothetical protein